MDSTIRSDVLRRSGVRDLETTSVVVAGPVIVSLMDSHTPVATTIAVGALDVHSLETEEGSDCILSVGDEWALGVCASTKVVYDGSVILLHVSEDRTFAISLPPTIPESEYVFLIGVLETSQCQVIQGPIPERLDGVVFLGNEYDKCGSDDFEFEGVRVPKGGSLCRAVALDAYGWFYWIGGGGKKERTRPSWKETNCVTCRRSADSRRIIWECYLVPQIGQEPISCKESLEDAKTAAAEKSAALWARRKGRLSSFASASVQAASRVVQGQGKGGYPNVMSSQVEDSSKDDLDDAIEDPELKAVKLAEQAAEVGQEAFTQAAKSLVALAINGYPRAIVSILSKRNKLLQKHSGDARKVAEMAMGKNGGFIEEAKHYLLALLPGIGIPAALVYPFWVRLRRVCLVASLFGHDMQDEAVQARIMYAAAGIEGGFRGHMADATLNTAVQTVWRSIAGPVTKLLPVGALVSFFAGVEGRMNEAVIKAFEDGPGVTQLEYMMQLDEVPTMNDFLQLVKDGGIHVAEQAVISGARRVGVDGAQEVGAKTAAKQAAEKLAKEAGYAVMTKAKEVKTKWSSA